MPKRDKRSALKSQPETLKGWQQIASFLASLSQSFSDGRAKECVSTSTEELNAWLGKESGKPVHVATEGTDLASELKRGLSFIRGKNQPSREKSQPRSAKRKEVLTARGQKDLYGKRI